MNSEQIIKLWPCVVASAIPVSLTFLRLWAVLRQVGTDLFDRDGYFHMLYTDAIRANNHRLRGLRDDRFLLAPEFTYPPGFHWLFSFASREKLARWQAYVPVAMRCLTTFLVALTCGATVLMIGEAPTPLAVSISIIGGLLYGTSPVVGNSNPSNLCYLTYSPRSFASLMLCAASLACVGAAITQSWWMIGLTVVLFAVTLISSQFAAQCLLFVIGGMSLFVGFWQFIPITIAAISLAGAISEGYYFRVLNGQVRHLIAYKKDDRNNVAEKARNIFTNLDLFRLVWYAVSFRTNDLFWLIKVNSNLRGLLLYPLHLFCGVLLLVYADIWMQQPWLYHMAVLWGAAMVVFVLTSLPAFAFLGEADRYMEYVGFLPATVLSLSLASAMPGEYLSGFTICAVILCIHASLCLIYPPFWQKTSEEYKSIWKYLANLASAGARALCIPVPEAREFVYRSSIPCAAYTNITPKVVEELQYEHPLPRLDFEYFVKKYGITHLIVRRAYLQNARIADAVKSLAVDFETEWHVIYGIASGRGNIEIPKPS